MNDRSVIVTGGAALLAVEMFREWPEDAVGDRALVELMYELDTIDRAHRG